jgi:hypothetical protein
MGSTGSVTLQPGVYYFAYAANDTTCAVTSMTPSTPIVSIMNANGSRQGTASGTYSGGVMPTPFGTLSTYSISPAIAFMEP